MAEVLIVDDDFDVAELLGEVIGNSGHDVAIAHDGEEGLREISQHRPGVVLLDVEMPLMSGPGMAHEMLVRNTGLEQIPIILLSGVVDLDEVAHRVGTPYFLGKPYTLRAVVQMCEKALAERTPPHPEASA